MVHDNTCVTVGLMPGALDDDISEGGFTHGDFLESGVVRQGITKKGCAKNIAWFGSQRDSLIGRPF